MHQYDRAATGYSRAIELRPNSAFVYYLRAGAYADGGQHKAALADYHTALKIDPQLAVAYNGRAWTYFKMGRSADGLPEVERALELDPKLSHAYDTRAHIYEALGRKDDAVPLEEAQEVLAADDRAGVEAAYDLKSLLATLPDKMRRAIECVKIEGLSVAEAAKRCGMSESAVKVNVHRGLRALAASMRTRQDNEDG